MTNKKLTALSRSLDLLKKRDHDLTPALLAQQARLLCPSTTTDDAAQFLADQQ